MSKPRRTPVPFGLTEVYEVFRIKRHIGGSERSSWYNRETVGFFATKELAEAQITESRVLSYSRRFALRLGRCYYIVGSVKPVWVEGSPAFPAVSDVIGLLMSRYSEHKEDPCVRLSSLDVQELLMLLSVNQEYMERARALLQEAAASADPELRERINQLLAE